MALLERFGMVEHEHKHPSQPSGGQKRRIAIARDPVAFVREGKVEAEGPS